VKSFLYQSVRLCLSLFAFLFLPLTCLATLPVPVEKALKVAKIPSDAVSLVVRPLKAFGVPQKNLIAHRANESVSPASTMKLLTTAAVLDRLGPNFRWRTQIYYTGLIKGDVLHGDLIFVGGGDPKFNYEDLSALVRKIRGTGVRVIKGRVLLDRSLFAPVSIAEGFETENVRAYQVPPDALLLSLHSVLVHFAPDFFTGVARVWLEPPLSIPFTSQVNLVESNHCDGWKALLKASVNVYEGIVIKGALSDRCDFDKTVWNVYPSWLTPNQYFTQVFQVLWKEQGGGQFGEVVEQKLPVEAKLMTYWESDPLSHMIEWTNKFSNNTMAQHLFLTLAAVEGASRPVTLESGHEAMLGWLQSVGISTNQVVFENGSGLSRAERVEADTLADVIEYMWNTPFQSEFIASLPIFGVDGTLSRRTQNENLLGAAHLKTGLLNGVRSIAGVVQDKKRQWHIVVFIVNHQNSDRALPAQDALLSWVIQSSS
jgi:D-alanyl-D-alanine carboxypeptidase/D-alanyl-D-alanine-endopeptidase (penicillin-binding protein 4)